MTHSTPCQSESCPFHNTESCNYSDPSECDLAKIFPPDQKKKALPAAPLYMKFSYKYEWRHLSPDEIYPVWTRDDFVKSYNTFREKHESQGELIVFATEDLIEWRVWGKVPAEETSA